LGSATLPARADELEPLVRVLDRHQTKPLRQCARNSGRLSELSEEHLVVETPQAGGYAVGDVVYAVPRHVCPTVALHDEAVVVRDRRAVDRWRVQARTRRISI